jgi:hypothetical protein
MRSTVEVLRARRRSNHYHGGSFMYHLVECKPLDAARECGVTFFFNTSPYHTSDLTLPNTRWKDPEGGVGCLRRSVDIKGQSGWPRRFSLCGEPVAASHMQLLQTLVMQVGLGYSTWYGALIFGYGLLLLLSLVKVILNMRSFLCPYLFPLRRVPQS